MGNDLMTTGSSNGGALTVHELKQRVNMVQQAMGSVMRDKVHYGTIPGVSKPSLWKPGSELLLSMFRIAVIPRVEDLGINGEVHYRVTCQGVLPNGEIVGEGVGECSSEEEKYKWRSAVCTAEFEDTPDDRRRLKYTRDGKKFQQVRMNSADVANTILKMAKKRAQMDLTLTCTGASDVFTQDVEDLPPEYLNQKAAPVTAAKPAAKPQATPAPKKQQPEDAELVEGDGVALSEKIELALDMLCSGDDASKKNLLMEASRGGKTSGPFLVYTKLHLPETNQQWLEKIYEYLEPKLAELQGGSSEEDVPC
jgi:hypothetical protein